MQKEILVIKKNKNVFSPLLFFIRCEWKKNYILCQKTKIYIYRNLLLCIKFLLNCSKKN